MAKKAKKKPPQAQGRKPKKKVFTYYAEDIVITETKAMVERLNIIGQHGWELLFFSGATAWFIGDETSAPPPHVSETA